jgi:branched-chain amino acid transport system ATP-binding protein
MSPILFCRDLVAGYVPGMPIVQGVSMAVAPGEVVCVIGPNGAGKSTFLKAVAGLVRPDNGVVELRGRDVTKLPPEQRIAAGLAFVPQTGNVFTTLTVHENLVVGGHTLGRELTDRLGRAYAQFPVLAERRTALGRALSGGQRQMLAIARGLMTAPNVLMLDEPTAGLSPKVVQEVLAELRQLAAGGIAILMVEQNVRAALGVADRAYVLAQGRNCLEGRASELLDNPALGSAFLGGRRQSA